ncbi:MAG TPA: hypothetical protein VN457_05485 [Chlamydiales bacterium]|nr:hypothetical protein [Chlamydiales bacterium]
MKGKFLALTLSFATLFFTTASAEIRTGHTLCSKEAVGQQFLRATGINPRSYPTAIVGAPIAAFQPITFSLHKLSNGQAIKLEKNKFRFELAPGSYEVAFTGSFRGVTALSVFDVGLLVGNDVKALMTTTLIPTFLTAVSFNTIITVEKETKVSVVVRNRGEATSSIQLFKRTISIVKLK